MKSIGVVYIASLVVSLYDYAMVLVVGEIAEEYRKIEGDEYRRVISGLGLEWAERIKDSYLLTVLASDNASRDMSSCLASKGIRYSSGLVSTLPSAVIAGYDRHYRGTAPVSLASEDVIEFTAGLDIEAAVVSSVLLSFNPSASAIVDALSFIVPQPRMAIDTSIVVEEGRNTFSKAVGDARASFTQLLVSSSKDEIAHFLGIE